MEIKNTSTKAIQSLDSNSYGKVEKTLPTDKTNVSGYTTDLKPEHVVEPTLSVEEITSNIKKINTQIQNSGLTLNYTKDENSGKTILELKDRVTNETIKQIPSKEMLQIADNIDKYLAHYSKSGTVAQKSLDFLINQKV